MSSGAGSPEEPTADLSSREPADGAPHGGDYSGVIGDTGPDADALRAMAGVGSRRACQRVAGFELIDRIDKDANNAFGEVWLARRVEPFQRVAIKFLRRDRVNDELVRRFSRAESKALARFNHPYIARFYELGFDGDTPYLVMQYVPGDRITAYCDKHGLSIRERLELMAKVCDAVQHVHLQGVVHRDLKPANILVSEARPEAEDARDAKDAPGAGDGVAAGKAPIPVLIDFGFAKSVNPDAPLASQVVSGIGRFAGTYAYAAPEQIKQRRDEDTGRQTDIYALGAVLFELIVGVSPMEHVLSDATLSDPERNLRLANDERPSMAAAYARLAPERQREVAAQRGTTVEAMKRLLRSRLAHLADRALRAKPAARFSDARAFALDIANYLADRDFMEAAAEPRLEKWRRAVRRNRVKVAAVSMICAATLLSVVILWVSLRKLEDRYERARRVVDQMASAQQEFLESEFQLQATTDVAAANEQIRKMRLSLLQRLISILSEIPAQDEQGLHSLRIAQLEARAGELHMLDDSNSGSILEAIRLFESAIDRQREAGSSIRALAERRNFARTLLLAAKAWKSLGTVSGTDGAESRAKALDLLRACIGVLDAIGIEQRTAEEVEFDEILRVEALSIHRRIERTAP